MENSNGQVILQIQASWEEAARLCKHVNDNLGSGARIIGVLPADNMTEVALPRHYQAKRPYHKKMTSGRRVMPVTPAQKLSSSIGASIKATGLKSGLVELFRSNPNKEFTNAEIKDVISQLGYNTAPSTAIHNLLKTLPKNRPILTKKLGDDGSNIYKATKFINQMETSRSVV